jgi:hypothetical protein
MQESDEELYKCISTSDTFHISRGDTCLLPFAKARVMQAMGAVKILGDPAEQGIPKQPDDEYLYRTKFSKRPGTRVAWMQNFSKNGGAEISNYNCIAIGRDIGFDVVGVVTNTLQSFNVCKEADVIVVNNLHSGNRETILDYLARTTIPWVKYEHDLQEEAFDLFQRSSLNVFISPMQRDFYDKKCGGALSRSVCLPLAIIPERWKYQADSRVPNTIFVPTYSKCRETIGDYIRENQDKKFIIADNVKPPFKNTENIGRLDYREMQEAYHKYETVYHCPDKEWAGDRVIFEAVLSGCKIITNKNAGHTSWDFNWKQNDELRKRLHSAIYDFWHEVERVADGN